MNALLIALGALAVGKIHGQDTVVSFIINTDTPAVSVNRRPIVYQEISQELQPPPLPRPTPLQNRERAEVPQGSNFNLPLREATTEHTQKLRNTAVTRQPIKMDLPANRRNETSHTNTNNTTARNNNKQNDNLAATTSSPKQELPARPESVLAKDNATSPEKPPVTVIGSAPTTNVTFDERANFDGDQCPSGYVRVNGKCVEED